MKYEAEMKKGKLEKDVMFTKEGKPLPLNGKEQEEK